MDYDTSLITGAQIVEFSGVQDLANLATDGELVLNTFALNAHREVFARIEGHGDLSILSNADRLKPVVADLAVAKLAAAGYLPGIDPPTFFGRVDAAIGSPDGSIKGYFRPLFTDTNSQRRINESLPSFSHLDSDGAYVVDL